MIHVLVPCANAGECSANEIFLGRLTYHMATQMHACWAALPADVVLHHVLPRCPIDTRLAFKIRPGKLHVAPDVHEKISDAMRLRKSVLATPQSKGELCAVIPLPGGHSLLVITTYASWLNLKYGRDILFFKVLKRLARPRNERLACGHCGHYVRIACVSVPTIMSGPRPQCCPDAAWR